MKPGYARRRRSSLSGAEDERYFQRGIPDELGLIVERAGRHRSDILRRIDGDEDGDPPAGDEHHQRGLPVGLGDNVTLAPGDTAHTLLLPVHSFRLYQVLELIKKVRAAATTDLSMNWLRPYMKRRNYRKGDILFRKGDFADEMFLVGKGKFRVIELDNELRPGEIFGEIGMLTTGYHRTQSVDCIESGHVLTIPYDEVRALYFENPEFGFYFLRIASQRLLEVVAHAEAKLAAERAAGASAR